MLTFLIGKRQKTIAWFLFLLFYTDMLGAAYASAVNNKIYYAVVGSSANFRIDNNAMFATGHPLIAASLINKSDLKKVTPVAKKEVAVKIDSRNLLNAKALLKAPAKTMIGGPGQPETSTFKSVGADNMVNLFTGDFSYNIPLLDVDGYPINIFYNAQPTMDQEASWVGLGWNINPGTMKALPRIKNGSCTMRIPTSRNKRP